MPKTHKSWQCHICQKPVSEISAYAKYSTVKYAHLICAFGDVQVKAIAIGREQILQEQREAKERETKEEVEAAHRSFDLLARCGRCGVKITPNNINTRWVDFGEVRPESSTRGVCMTCIRDEVQARARARNATAPSTPAQAIQTASTRPIEVDQKPKTVEETQAEYKRPIEID